MGAGGRMERERKERKKPAGKKNRKKEERVGEEMLPGCKRKWMNGEHVDEADATEEPKLQLSSS